MFIAAAIVAYFMVYRGLVKTPRDIPLWLGVILLVAITALCVAAVWKVQQHINDVRGGASDDQRAAPFTVRKEFEAAYNAYRDRLKVSRPEGAVKILGYYAQHDKASVIWIKEDNEFYLLSVDKKRTECLRDDSPPDEWSKDSYIRTMIDIPEGKDPPWAGVAYGWHRHQELWDWIGWRQWHCLFHEGVYKQEFEGGVIIGPFPLNESNKFRRIGVFIVIYGENRWRQRVTDGEGPPCTKPITNGD